MLPPSFIHFIDYPLSTAHTITRSQTLLILLFRHYSQIDHHKLGWRAWSTLLHETNMSFAFGAAGGPAVFGTGLGQPQPGAGSTSNHHARTGPELEEIQAEVSHGFFTSIRYFNGS